VRGESIALPTPAPPLYTDPPLARFLKSQLATASNATHTATLVMQHTLHQVMQHTLQHILLWQTTIQLTFEILFSTPCQSLHLYTDLPMVIILKRQLATQLTIEPDFNCGRNSNKANFVLWIPVFWFSGKSTTTGPKIGFYATQNLGRGKRWNMGIRVTESGTSSGAEAAARPS